MVTYIKLLQIRVPTQHLLTRQVATGQVLSQAVFGLNSSNLTSRRVTSILILVITHSSDIRDQTLKKRNRETTKVVSTISDRRWLKRYLLITGDHIKNYNIKPHNKHIRFLNSSICCNDIIACLLCKTKVILSETTCNSTRSSFSLPICR